MAILTTNNLTQIRQDCAKDITVNYKKAEINLALQAIEDWFEANRASLAAAINTATTPFVFTNPQKVKLVKHWLLSKFGRE